MSDDHTYFILIVQNNKIPSKKGPLRSREQATQYLKELPQHYPNASFIVAQIPPGVKGLSHDLWLTDGSEWLICDEISKMPDDDGPMISEWDNGDES